MSIQWFSFKRFTSLVLIFVTPCVYADNYNQHVADIINKTLSENTQPVTVGIKIQSMATHQTIYSKHADELFVPASSLKLFTALGAYLLLSPNFSYQTQLLTDNKNIYIKFSGDPSLTSDDINNLFISLKKSGVSTITGNIYLDDSALGGRNSGPGWMWDEINLCYAAPINSIMINGNCVNYNLNPNATLQPATPSDAVNIINQVIVSNQDPKSCPLNLTTTGQNEYLISGCIPKDAKAQNLQIAVSDPAAYAKNIINLALKNNQISLNGKILDNAAPTGLKIAATHFSKPLSDLIRTMLKNSDDHIAGELFKAIGSHYYQEPTHWGQNTEALDAILKKNTDINLSHAVITDGSGISRYNLVSPDQISQLLAWVFQNKALAKPFIESLPVAGKDGTLQGRMTDLKDNVYAKTGSMTDVVSLSGYVQTKNHSVLSFVIMFNNFSMTEKQAEDVEDKIVEQLAST